MICRLFEDSLRRRRALLSFPPLFIPFIASHIHSHQKFSLILFCVWKFEFGHVVFQSLLFCISSSFFVLVVICLCLGLLNFSYLSLLPLFSFIILLFSFIFIAREQQQQLCSFASSPGSLLPCPPDLLDIGVRTTRPPFALLLYFPSFSSLYFPLLDEKSLSYFRFPYSFLSSSKAFLRLDFIFYFLFYFILIYNLLLFFILFYFLFHSGFADNGGDRELKIGIAISTRRRPLHLPDSQKEGFPFFILL